MAKVASHEFVEKTVEFWKDTPKKGDIVVVVPLEEM